MTRIKNLAISSLAVLGLTLTPMPAAADTEDVAKLLAGLAVLGIIAKSVDDRNDRNDGVTNRFRLSNRAYDNRRNAPVIRGEILRPGEFNLKKSKSPKYKRRPLPDRCLRLIDTSRRDRLAYSRGCLNRNYKFANRLPRDCQRLIRTNRGVRTVYGARCLARDGWRVARR